MLDQPIVGTVGEIQIVSIREERPSTDLPSFVPHALGELYGRLGVLGVAPSGPPFVLYHSFGPDAIDAEVCLPVAVEVLANGHVHARTLPEVTVARTLHIGPYETIERAYATAQAWIAANGYEAAGPFRERYLNAPGEVASPDELRTEIEIPIEPAEEPALA